MNLLVADPVLPEWLPAVELRGLRVAKTTATPRFWRDEEGRSHARITERDGPLHLIRQPPPESLRAGWGRRLRAAIRRWPRLPCAE